jgi:elongation factor 1-beta
VVSFQELKEQPSPGKYPGAYRWYKNIASYISDFSSLPGDPSKPYTAYGPEQKEVASHPKNAHKNAEADEEEEEEDLFGSDDEEEDAEAVKIREENLAAYKKTKEGKTKPAAKSIVTLDVKPWGESNFFTFMPKRMRSVKFVTTQTTKRT